MGEIASFYWRVLRLAFGDVLGLTGALLLVLFIAAGLFARFWPDFSIRGHKVTAEWAQGWRVAILVLGTILLIRLALAPFWIWQNEYSQRISVTQELKNPITIDFQWEKGEPFVVQSADRTLWIRVKAINHSANDVLCRVYLNDLQKVGGLKPLWSGEQLELYWSGNEYDAPGNTDRTVPAGKDRIFNLGFIHNDANMLSFQNPQFAAEVTEKLSPGTYKFTIQANHSTCRSDPTEILVKYQGNQDVQFVKQQKGARN